MICAQLALEMQIFRVKDYGLHFIITYNASSSRIFDWIEEAYLHTADSPHTTPSLAQV